VQTTFIFNDLSIPNFILGEFGGFEKPVGQFRPNVQYNRFLSPQSNAERRRPGKNEENISNLESPPLSKGFQLQ
jgi:hypothetical protein